ncbi:MAG: FHA domain-containing protein [Candidatus Omnitrophota bacterium]
MIKIKDRSSSNATTTIKLDQEYQSQEVPKGGDSVRKDFIGSAWIRAGNSSFRVWIEGNEVKVQQYSRDKQTVTGSKTPMTLSMYQEHIIGRDESNAVSVSNDGSVSRRHFSLVVTRDSFDNNVLIVKDLNSTNRTYLDWISSVLEHQFTLKTEVQGIKNKAMITPEEEKAAYQFTLNNGSKVTLSLVDGRSGMPVELVFNNNNGEITVQRPGGMLNLISHTEPYFYGHERFNVDIQVIATENSVTIKNRRKSKLTVSIVPETKDSGHSSITSSQEVGLIIGKGSHLTAIEEPFVGKVAINAGAQGHTYYVWIQEGKLMRQQSGAQGNAELKELSFDKEVIVAENINENGGGHFSFMVSENGIIKVKDLSSSKASTKVTLIQYGQSGVLPKGGDGLQEDFIGSAWVVAGNSSYRVWSEGDSVRVLQYSMDKKSVKGERPIELGKNKEYKFGGAQDNDVAIEDEGLSGHHFTLQVTTDAEGHNFIKVIDTNSTNGTRLDWIPEFHRYQFALKNSSSTDISLTDPRTGDSIVLEFNRSSDQIRFKRRGFPVSFDIPAPAPYIYDGPFGKVQIEANANGFKIIVLSSGTLLVQEAVV